ncbi:MAG TPA: hypothetical protein PK886_02105 [Candidatus Paceibacterota bacterium]|nr:hypothetical protein [Candidatus Paceibacterota bacterium]
MKKTALSTNQADAILLEIENFTTNIKRRPTEFGTVKQLIEKLLAKYEKVKLPQNRILNCEIFETILHQEKPGIMQFISLDYYFKDNKTRSDFFHLLMYIAIIRGIKFVKKTN